MVIRLKTIITAAIIAITVTVIAVAAVRGIDGSTAAMSEETVSSDIKVVVDAGHGAPDGGAVGVNGTSEKDINLAIALKLREVFENKGIQVIMTRETDSGIWDKSAVSIREKKRSDMQNRLEIIQKSGADLFLSIHMNSYTNESASGLRVFYDREHEEGERLSEEIQERIASVTGADTNAVKTVDEKLFLMKSPVMPSILVECGFISNAEEEKKLNDDKYQSQIAWAIAESVENFFKNKKNAEVFFDTPCIF